ncbi:MAG TPA: transketolase [Pyrinomonadaceae bacterium]|jgi:transketolase
MSSLKDDASLVQRLQAKSSFLRHECLRMIYQAGSGHPGGSFSATEIVTVLFYHVMRHEAQDARPSGHDRFILSKGHAAPILYAVLADLGRIDRSELATLRQIGSRLQGHPCRVRTPGIETSGSLGQGLSIGCGLAYSLKKLDGSSSRVYVLLGDGELNEGQIWEAAMFARHYALDNLIAVVDRNHLQFVGATEEVMALEPLAEKWRAFGWHVEELADGHDISALLKAFGEICNRRGQPTVIIANTVKGKGVSFMEHNLAWHGTAPGDEQFAAAWRELEETDGQPQTDEGNA